MVPALFARALGSLARVAIVVKGELHLLLRRSSTSWLLILGAEDIGYIPQLVEAAALSRVTLEGSFVNHIHLAPAGVLALDPYMWGGRLTRVWLQLFCETYLSVQDPNSLAGLKPNRHAHRASEAINGRLISDV